jgi:hypothetical protein
MACISSTSDLASSHGKREKVAFFGNAKVRLRRCAWLHGRVDKLLPHKAALFSHLRARWQDLFAAKFDVLLYDLTSTYFES